MDKTDRKTNKTRLIIVILAIAVLMMVVLLLALPNMKGNKKFISKEHGYSLVYDSSVLKYERICLNQADGINMDRFEDVKSGGLYYLAVTDISEDVDLEKEMDILEKNENYSFAFVRESGIPYGKKGYKVRRISYTDRSGSTPLSISYYYDVANGIMITVCTDDAHKSFFEKMLNTIEIK